MQNQSMNDVMEIQSISAIPTILEAVAAITGLRFVCVAHVTSDSWTACAVLDQLDFGLKPGDSLDISTTLCEEVRNTNKAIIIDRVSEDMFYKDHYTPKMYGFESYISVPIVRKNGEYFGTICGLDPLPANLSNTATIASMTMFAELISLQLFSENQLAVTSEALLQERKTAELREQFIAVLGHDVRNPLSAIVNAANALTLMPNIAPPAATAVRIIQGSAQRISGLIDDVLDFTRGRMGGGIGIELSHQDCIADLLEQVVSELSTKYPDRKIATNIRRDLVLCCDQGRMGQLLSNLVKNALVHGDPKQPIHIEANVESGIFTLAVTNSGPPLSPDTIKKLFNPYWRAAGKSVNEGLGLGLFIVSEIARSHGGEIRVVSADEKISFILTIKTAEFIERRRSQQCRSGFIERRQYI